MAERKRLNGRTRKRLNSGNSGAAPESIRKSKKSHSSRAHLPEEAELIAPISIIEACCDDNLFGKSFKNVETWSRWFVFLKALFGLQMDPDEALIYKEFTKRKTLPTRKFKEGWLVVGRRGGKSAIISVIATFLACFYDWTPFLSPGERGTVMILAADRKQARVIFRYIQAILQNPFFKGKLERETAESFDLSNRITIEVSTASYRTVRGYTVIAALMDEIAFWRSDNTSNPDVEVLDALRPATATVPGAMILGISSPYARRGVLWNIYSRYFGKDSDDILVWQAPTWEMNPVVPGYIIEDAYKKDAAKAEAEYGAQFRRDVSALLPREVVEDCTDWGVRERPYVEGIEYRAFVDPSGGSQDSFTLGIAHDEDDVRVLDVLRDVEPPFVPQDIVKEFSDLVRSYGISEVVGDRYAGEWVSSAFEQEGIVYTHSEKNKSQIYLEALPLFNSGKIRLLDNEKLRNQFVNLERRSRSGGRDSIDHPPGSDSHDDAANSAAGAVVSADALEPLAIW